MLRTKTAVLALGLLALATDRGAVAEQTGGLPALADQVNALQGTVASLQGTVASLQAANTTLQTTVTSLQNALNTEIAARTAGDSTLQTTLSQETAQRVAAVASVQTALSAETTNRINGDQQLENQVTDDQPLVFTSNVIFRFLTNDFGNVVASVTIPPGDYLFHAAIDVHNGDSDTQSGGCSLEQVSPGTSRTQTPVFFVSTQTGAINSFAESPFAILEPFNLQGSPEDSERLTVLAHAHVTAQAEWAVTCVGFNWQTVGGQLVAVKLGPIKACNVNGICSDETP